MTLPRFERVVYRKPCLVEVITQLRFQPILRITAEQPSAFQESIRQAMPLYSEKAPEIPQNLPPDIINIISGINSGSKFYEFLSEDRRWKIALANDFISLSTKNYNHWDEFSERLKNPLGKLIEVYTPPFFDRIGLRYRNKIDRKELGLHDVPWSELLHPHIAAELSDRNVSENVIQTKGECLLKLENDDGFAYIRRAKINDDRFLIDTDFYYDKRTEPENAFRKLSNLNKYAGNLFRMHITDRLFHAMEPEPVGSK